MCDDCYAKIEKPVRQICQKCSEPITRGVICNRCRKIPPHYSTLISLGFYSGTLRDAILTLKYKRNIGIGVFFAEPLSKIILNQGWKIDLVTAVPLSVRRKRERGYNQAEVLAKPLAQRLGWGYSNQLVHRKKETNSQVGLNLRERQLNMLNAFEAINGDFSGKTILIVDDVATTGSTMDACAKVLLEAGCKEVFGLTLGKTIGMQDAVVE